MLVRNTIPNNKSGIYQIQSIKTGKIYIGSATNIKTRIINNYFKNLSDGTHYNRYLQRHVNKYGMEDFVFKVVEYCPKENLIEREQYYIDTLKPKFNLSKSAKNTFGYKHTKSQNLKSSKARKLLFKTEQGKILREKMKITRNNFFETKEGVQWKKEHSTFMSNRDVSIYTKQKMKVSRKNFLNSKEGSLFKEKESKWLSKQWKDPVFRQTNIENRKQYWNSSAGLLRKQKLKIFCIERNKIKKHL